MYKIELTSNDNRETLLKECYIDTWNDTCKEIKKFQDLNMNILIRLYNENMDCLGNFTNIKQKNITPQKKKHFNKIKLSTKIIILECLLFPIILLKEIIKEY